MSNMCNTYKLILANASFKWQMQVICDLQHALQKSFNRNENTGPLKLSPFFKKQNKKQTKKKNNIAYYICRFWFVLN